MTPPSLALKNLIMDKFPKRQTSYTDFQYLSISIFQKAITGKYSGIWQAFKLIYKEEGFTALW